MIAAKSAVLLPAHNEQDSIVGVVADVLGNCDADVIVAASGCTDDTPKLVKDYFSNNSRVKLLDCPKGKGNAVRQAFEELYAEKIVMLDSDGTYPVRRIPDFLNALDNYQVVVGKRQMSDTNMPRGNKYSNRFVSLQARLLYGIPIRDLCSGMWGFRGDIPRLLNLQSPGFTLETEMFWSVARHGLSWTHLPIEYYPRIGERKIHRLDHLKIWRAIWTRKFGE